MKPFKFSHVLFEYWQMNGAEEWITALKKFKLHVVIDPLTEPAAMNGYFICSKKPTKAEFRTMLVRTYGEKTVRLAEEEKEDQTLDNP